MQCPSCGQNNIDGRQRCVHCGSPLVFDCPYCGALNQRGASACRVCVKPFVQPSDDGSERTLPASFQAGRYRVIGFLGEGASKLVYKAQDTKNFDKSVAFSLFKVQGLDQASRKRIVHELMTMATLLDHPRLIALYDHGEENGLPFIVSPHMAGGSLAESA